MSLDMTNDRRRLAICESLELYVGVIRVKNHAEEAKKKQIIKASTWRKLSISDRDAG